MKIIFLAYFLSLSVLCQAKTILVGKNQPVKSIKAAIAQSSDGDTIIVDNGIYKEGRILINKQIVLIGKNFPILDGENKSEIISVNADRVVVKGFKIINSGYASLEDPCGIRVYDKNNVVIENNILDNNFFGIYIQNSKNCLIKNNTIKAYGKAEQLIGNGIHCWKSENLQIIGNKISGHRDGIYFEFVTHSYIYQNHSHNNIRYGLHFMFSNNNTYMENTFIENGAGVAVMYSNHVLMQRNTFKLNWGPNAYGLLLKEISDAHIINNTFDQNTAAIQMESTNRIEVQSNEFKSNGWALRISASCDESVIHHNNFSANTFDVATNGTMMLNNFYNNYWDKYDGYDMNKDGIGDIAYHPVSMYSMVIEQNPNSLLLLRSFMVSLLDKAEKAIPSLTPENLVDKAPLIRRMNHDQN